MSYQSPFLSAKNLFPDQLVNSSLYPPLPYDPSGGYDGVYQFSNENCFLLVTSQLQLSFQVISVDGQVLAGLRSLGAANLPAPLSAYVSGTSAPPADLSIVLTVEPKDLLFANEQNACVIEYGVFAYLAVVVPNVPGSSNTPVLPSVNNPNGPGSGRTNVGGNYFIQIVNLNYPSGANYVAGVLAYLGTGTLQIPGTYGVEVDAAQALLDANATLNLAQLTLAGATGNLGAFFSQSDPVGLVGALRASLAPHSIVALMPEICPLGPGAGMTGVFTNLEASIFPTGLPLAPTATSLTVALTVGPTIGNSADVPDLVSSVDYAVVASGLILAGLAKQRWTIGNFPSSLPSSGPVQVIFNGQTTNAMIVGSYKFLSLDSISIESDSNARGDVIVFTGTGKEFPSSILLPNGQTVLPQGADDPNFQPGPLSSWVLAGTLVENLSGAPANDIMDKGITSDVTIYLGRPFTGGVIASVTDARVSAPLQRIQLLCNLTAPLAA